MLLLEDLKEIVSSDFSLMGDVDNEEHCLRGVCFNDEEVTPYLEYEVIDIFHHWWQPNWDSFETELVIDVRKRK